jgi:hypothetical protein
MEKKHHSNLTHGNIVEYQDTPVPMRNVEREGS